MANPTCAVIIPIGPGHEACAEKAIASVRAAWEHPHAPFDRLEILTVNDRKGTLGRSAARNQGVREAQKQQCDWLFFLDADDTMLPCAFAVMSAYVADYDAVWGKIVETMHDVDAIFTRTPQREYITSLQELLATPAQESLQMGHFVRTEAAAATPFNPRLNAGEDFDYYLRLWEKYRCIKQPEPLFVNVRGIPSTGPHAASAHDWQRKTEALLTRYREKYTP